MGLKNWPYWLRGGLIGGVVFLTISVLYSFNISDYTIINFLFEAIQGFLLGAIVIYIARTGFSYWKRGIIIAFFSYLIIIIPALLISRSIEYFPLTISSLIITLVSFIGFLLLLPFATFFAAVNIQSIYLVQIFGFVFWIIIGAIIGLIVGKIKSKKMERGE
jgi:hypothetical protein